MSDPSVKPTAIDLFCGAGGFSLGFHRAGFRVVAASDWDEEAASTYRRNFPCTPFAVAGVETLDTADLLDLAGTRPGGVDVMVGGPPCQGFSRYNHNRGLDDERTGLFREYLRLVAGVAPRVVVMENVTGMATMADGAVVEDVRRSFEELGYRVDHRILRAEDFGVPQRRRRLFFVATRDGRFEWPTATHADAGSLFVWADRHEDFVTVGDAVRDLPGLANGEGVADGSPYGTEATCAYQRLMRENSEGVFNHEAPQLGDVNMRRIAHVGRGGNWEDIPEELLPDGMRQARRGDHTKRYARLEWDDLFTTILTKADLHWGAFVHPSQDRTYTVRECARAQSFLDRFVFEGSRTAQYRQVGNAVPPLLAEALANAIRRHLHAGCEV